MADELTLNEADRKKLDGIVQQMTANKEADADIQFVVNDFKTKYGQKKKSKRNYKWRKRGFIERWRASIRAFYREWNKG